MPFLAHLLNIYLMCKFWLKNCKIRFFQLVESHELFFCPYQMNTGFVQVCFAACSLDAPCHSCDLNIAAVQNP